MAFVFDSSITERILEFVLSRNGRNMSIRMVSCISSTEFYPVIT